MAISTTSQLVIGCMLCFVVAITTGIDPYTPGTFEIDEVVFDPKKDGCPLYSTAYFPKKSKGPFIPIPFIGGFNGYMIAEMYSDFLKLVAAHGYIVVGMDPIHFKPETLRFKSEAGQPRLGSLGSGQTAKEAFKRRNENLGDAAKYYSQIQWLKENMNAHTYAQADWSKPTIMCQSSGCDRSLEMMYKYKDMVKAAMFMDPMCTHTIFMKPFASDINFLAHMSELSEHKPTCCIKGLGWRKVYSLMETLKVGMVTNMTGHCDILNEESWRDCHLIGLCYTTDDSCLPSYHSFLAGLVHAFLEWTVSGIASMKPYVTDPTHMPYAIKELVYNATR